MRGSGTSGASLLWDGSLAGVTILFRVSKSFEGTDVYATPNLTQNQGAKLRRRQDPLDRMDLACHGSRALIRTGGEMGVAHLSPEEEYELRLYDRRVSIHYHKQNENLVSARKGQRYQRLLFDQWPVSRRRASVRSVLIVVGMLWNLTYVVRAGRYFVWRLLRLTGLHDASARNNHNRIAEFVREFQAGVLCKNWVIDLELLLKGEALSAPCSMAI